MSEYAVGPLVRAFRSTASNAAELGMLLVEPNTSLPLSPAGNRTIWDRDAGTLDHYTIRSLLAEAERDIALPWPQPLASAAARISRDGNRTEWERPAFARQRRLSRAAIAAAVTLEDRWIDEVADGIILLCEQTSWCWPAHDDVFARNGAALSDPKEPFLDLGAGEVAGQLAWLDHLLGDSLDSRFPGIRARLRSEVVSRVLRPFASRRDWHWLGLNGDVHNWNPWIHGNVLTAALRLLDGPENRKWRAELVWLVIEGLDRYVASLPDDGAIDEGYGYWWNGACRALEALDLLRSATNGRLDGTTATNGLRATVAFPHRMHLGRDWYVDFADSQALPPREQPWHALYRAAIAAGDEEARRHSATYRRAGAPTVTDADGLGRLLLGLCDTDWRDATADRAPLPRDIWLPSIQVLVARERAESSVGLTVVAKGGHNGEHHNHNDVGSFIVASDGVPVIVDPGRGTYTASTFSADRYSNWALRSDWHNTPEIDGILQAPGAEHCASNVVSTVAEEFSALSLDLESAYPGTDVRWHREVRLERLAADRVHARVVIDDTWTSAHTPEAIVRMVIAGEVRLSRGQAHISPRDGAPPLTVRWPPEVEATLTIQTLTDPLLVEVWGPRLTRFDFAVADRGSFTVVVESEPPRDEDNQ